MAGHVTAREIEEQEFSRRLRGYDAQEVRLYLRSVAEEVERLNLENGRLREQMGQVRDEVEQVRSREVALQQTLVTAQRVTEEMKERARAESELTLREARQRADQIVGTAKSEIARLDDDISRARLERDDVERRLRGVIEQHLAVLDMRRQARTDSENLRAVATRAG